MKVTFCKNPSTDVTLELGENIHIWFGSSTFDDREDCHNALLLAGGDLVILKTVDTIPHRRLEALYQDYDQWTEVFGTGQVSDALRTALQYFEKANG